MNNVERRRVFWLKPPSQGDSPTPGVFRWVGDPLGTSFVWDVIVHPKGARVACVQIGVRRPFIAPAHLRGVGMPLDLVSACLSAAPLPVQAGERVEVDVVEAADMVAVAVALVLEPIEFA